MLKWIVAVVLIVAMLSVAGCCCCSGYDRYSYSTVGQDKTCVCPSCDTPYDCLNSNCANGGACSGTCTCQK